MAQQLTWRKAIETVLSETPGAIHYTDLSDKIIEKKLRTSLSIDNFEQKFVKAEVVSYDDYKEFEDAAEELHMYSSEIMSKIFD